MKQEIINEIQEKVGSSLLFDEKEINEIECIAGDSLMEVLEENPTEDRFNETELVSAFAQSFTCYIATSLIIGVPYQVWRITCKDSYKKLKDYSKLADVTVPEAIIDLAIEKIVDKINKWFPSKKEIEEKNIDN
jgi:hypothetical protein